LLILGVEPGDGWGRGFKYETEHEVVLGKEGLRAKKYSGGGGWLAFGVDGNGLPIGTVVELWTSSLDQADFEGAVLKLEFCENGNAACIVGHPYFHPAFVAGGGAVGFTQDFDPAARSKILQLEGFNFSAGNFREEGLFIFNDLPGDGASGLPWVGADVVEHGTKVLIWTFKEIEILLGFAGCGEKAAQPDRVVGEGSAIANVTSFASILNIFYRTPGEKLCQGGDTSADRVKGFDRSAGAKEKLESFDAFAFGFSASSESGFSSIDGSPLDEVGEFLAFRPGKGSGGLGGEERRKCEKPAENEGAHD